jgi:hypothetical protein
LARFAQAAVSVSSVLCLVNRSIFIIEFCICFFFLCWYSFCASDFCFSDSQNCSLLSLLLLLLPFTLASIVCLSYLSFASILSICFITCFVFVFYLPSGYSFFLFSACLFAAHPVAPQIISLAEIWITAVTRKTTRSLPGAFDSASRRSISCSSDICLTFALHLSKPLRYSSVVDFGQQRVHILYHT